MIARICKAQADNFTDHGPVEHAALHAKRRYSPDLQCKLLIRLLALYTELWE